MRLLLSEKLLQQAKELPLVEPMSNPPEGGQLLEGLLPEGLRHYEALFYHIGRQYHTAQAEKGLSLPTSPEGIAKALEVRALRRKFALVKQMYDTDVEDSYGMLGQPVKLHVCKGWEVYLAKVNEFGEIGNFFAAFGEDLASPPRPPGR